MSKKLHMEDYQPSMFSAEDFPVRMLAWQESGKGWMESEVDSGLSLSVLLASINQDGLSLKMSPAYFPLTGEPTLDSSFTRWSNSGMVCAGGYLTLSISEWPKGADVCSLSDILEQVVPTRYFLSAKATRGITRRLNDKGIA